MTEKQSGLYVYVCIYVSIYLADEKWTWENVMNEIDWSIGDDDDDDDERVYVCISYMVYKEENSSLNDQEQA
ncbi:hypothetical protein M430DRAFT_177768 [Amorphotheca resinae ATCC 22711]|jgi:hypothetical protein|uniref:Uncharacterized protein n=1 Tax=Amorphotheca resinae ATCC 22711 TaxID=857342 RepID=A0A2T3ATA3_AMORE|nr:hypothetical protein M430DRAFT_177768 [Amorphotheca resinae ATCC 22711]PSS10681.1 hypothetical protein M430DRAFT_177768 [Amorphotheca resinae ATCC 22711]